jgi:hypothetical protein
MEAGAHFPKKYLTEKVQAHIEKIYENIFNKNVESMRRNPGLAKPSWELDRIPEQFRTPEEIAVVKQAKIDEAEEMEQTAVKAGIGSAGTLIKQECDFALYVFKWKNAKDFYLMAFHPSGQVIRYNIEIEKKKVINKSVITDAMKDINNVYLSNKMEYTVWLSGKQVNNLQQGDRIKIAEVFYIGGWNSRGKLILAEKRGKVVIYHCLYVGYVKNSDVFFDENCGLE